MIDFQPPPDGGGGPWGGRRRFQRLPGMFQVTQQQGDDEVILVAERLDGHKNFAKTHAVLIGKLLKNLFSKGYRAGRPWPNGNVNITVVSRSQAEKALEKEHTVENSPVIIRFTKHNSLNSSKGVVTSDAIEEMNIEEIKLELKSQRVTEVERMKRFVNGKEDYTNNYKLTFDSPTLPERVTVGDGYLSLRVRTFYDNPLRCTFCQKYQHTRKRCPVAEAKGAQICRNCAKPLPHVNVSEECQPEKCVNCGGNHPSNHRNCEIRIKEVAIRRLQIDSKISAFVARKRFEQTNDQSYADVVNNNIRNARNPGREPDQIEREQLKAMAEQMKILQQKVEQMSGLKSEVENLKQKLVFQEEVIKDLEKENEELKAKLNLQGEFMSAEEDMLIEDTLCADSSGSTLVMTKIKPKTTRKSNSTTQTIKKDDYELVDEVFMARLSTEKQREYCRKKQEEAANEGGICVFDTTIKDVIIISKDVWDDFQRTKRRKLHTP